MARSWLQQIRHIQDGEFVRAGVAGRPDRAMESRTDYLKDRLDASGVGELLIAYGQSITEDALIGQAVYWNDEDQRFDLALAGVTSDPVTGDLLPSAASYCIGVVYYKTNATLADILLLGKADLNLVNALDEDLEAGVYYLSSQTPGHLTHQRPAVSVTVLYADSQGKVFVQPQWRDFIHDHTHYAVDLVAKPAGEHTPPAIDERHVIDTPDAALQGWLPADHASFNGNAPSLAAFGYNLEAHPELQRIWPPIPIDAAVMVLDRGENRVGGTEVPLGPDGLVILDENGIWWMSDCYDDVPWPTDLDTSVPETPPPVLTTPECPRLEQMRIRLSYARMAYATNQNVVTSLHADPESPIKIENCEGEPGSTGRLCLRFVSSFLISPDEELDGFLFFKSLDEQGVFHLGPAVTGIKAQDESVTITGERVDVVEGDNVYRGIVSIQAVPNSAQYDLPVQIVRLDDVRERDYNGVLYLGFPVDFTSSIRCKIKIPGSGLPANPALKLRLQFLGRSAGTLPDFTMTYRRLPRPDVDPVPLPDTDTSLTVTVPAVVEADEYVETESEAFEIAAGDTVLFTLTRTAGDGYSGEVGLLDVVGILHTEV